MVVVSILCLGCNSGDDLQLGNGFFIRSSGLNFELHAAYETMYLKKGWRTTRVWGAQVRRDGFPCLVGDGILFAAWDPEEHIALLGANQQGVVSDITKFVTPVGVGPDRPRNFFAASDAGTNVNIVFYCGSNHAPITNSYPKMELLRIAAERVAKGTKVHWKGGTVYR